MCKWVHVPMEVWAVAFSEPRISGSYESPDVGTGNRTWVLYNSSMCSDPVSHHLNSSFESLNNLHALRNVLLQSPGMEDNTPAKKQIIHSAWPKISLVQMVFPIFLLIVLEIYLPAKWSLDQKLLTLITYCLSWGFIAVMRHYSPGNFHKGEDLTGDGWEVSDAWFIVVMAGSMAAFRQTWYWRGS